jgi:hypothetical protein
MPTKKPTRTQRLRRLLQAGYFPEELPPPFVSRDLAHLRAVLGKSWPAQALSQFKSEPEVFSTPKFGRARRRLAIVNPISHYKISSLIAGGWTEIRDQLARSTVSEFKPVYDMAGERAFFGLDFERIEQRTNSILAQYHYSLKTDIARFYPTIYTHSIAWALYGKAYCKANLHKSAFEKSLGNQLDVAIRKCQDNQSLGIPIGPDTSRVLGEIIGVGIEKLLDKLVDSFPSRGLRYVDDIIIGYSERTAPIN